MQVGDGTTTVVILAGEFLRESKPFVEEGVHPQSLIRSFRQAGQLAVQKVKDLSISIEGKSAEEKADMLKKCAMTSLNSKLVCILQSYQAIAYSPLLCQFQNHSLSYCS
jgi:T-complex protein 1 subunit eta